MKKTVLITGAMGFIGSNIAAKLKLEGYTVTGIGHGSASAAQLRNMGIDEWIEADLTIHALKKIKGTLNLIVHCAGGSTVGSSLANPHLDYHKTVFSTLELLEYIRIRTPETPVIYLSSAAVYGSKEDEMIYEDSACNPVSPYGFHKLASESICKSYHVCFGIKVAVVRLFSIYGEGLKKQLLWEACQKIVRADQKVTFFGSGEETRDWLHVHDVARLVSHLASTDFGYLLLNGGFGKKTSVKEILGLLLKNMDKRNVKIVFNNELKEGDPKFYHAFIGNTLSIGWEPGIPLETGIKNYVNWFMSNYD